MRFRNFLVIFGFFSLAFLFPSKAEASFGQVRFDFWKLNADGTKSRYGGVNYELKSSSANGDSDKWLGGGTCYGCASSSVIRDWASRVIEGSWRGSSDPSGEANFGDGVNSGFACGNSVCGGDDKGNCNPFRIDIFTPSDLGGWWEVEFSGDPYTSGGNPLAFVFTMSNNNLLTFTFIYHPPCDTCKKPPEDKPIPPDAGANIIDASAKNLGEPRVFSSPSDFSKGEFYDDDLVSVRSELYLSPINGGAQDSPWNAPGPDPGCPTDIHSWPCDPECVRWGDPICTGPCAHPDTGEAGYWGCPPCSIAPGPCVETRMHTCWDCTDRSKTETTTKDYYYEVTFRYVTKSREGGPDGPSSGPWTEYPGKGDQNNNVTNYNTPPKDLKDFPKPGPYTIILEGTWVEKYDQTDTTGTRSCDRNRGTGGACTGPTFSSATTTHETGNRGTFQDTYDLILYDQIICSFNTVGSQPTGTVPFSTRFNYNLIDTFDHQLDGQIYFADGSDTISIATGGLNGYEDWEGSGTVEHTYTKEGSFKAYLTGMHKFSSDNSGYMKPPLCISFADEVKVKPWWDTTWYELAP